MERRKGLLHSVGIPVLMLLCIPVGLLICVAGLQCGFPTPGIWVGSLFGGTGVAGVITIPILLAVGLVNGVCAYAFVFGLIAVMSRFRTREGPGQGRHYPKT